MVYVTTKKKKEDEDRQKRIDEGNQYIQQREKAASKLSQTGNISVKAARKQAAQGITAELEGKSARGEQITVDESRQAQAERKAKFQEGLDIATSMPSAPVKEQLQQQGILGALGQQIGKTDIAGNPVLAGLTGLPESVQVPVGAKAAVGGAVLAGVSGGGALGALFSRKLALQGAAKLGVSKLGGAAASFFGLKSLLSHPAKRMESMKTDTTTMGEQISLLDSGLDAGLDPITTLEKTAEYRRELAQKEEDLKLLMIHSIQQQTNPEKSQDVIREINKKRTQIYFTEQKALQKLAQGNTMEFDPDEFEAWMKDSGFKIPEDKLPKQKGEVPFNPLAKEGVDFATA